MKIGIIGAMEEEVRLLVAKLIGKKETTIGNTIFYEGIIDEQEIVLARSGIGKVQAGMTTAIMLYQFKPEVVINTGSAGAIGTGMAIGDLVIATGVAYHDVDLTPADYPIGQLPNLPQVFKTDDELVTNIELAATVKTHQGLIVTGDQFVAGKEQIAGIKANFPAALACEMEGAAIGQVAYQFGVPFVVVRAMSDGGDEDADSNFDEFIEQAGRQSAEMLLTYIAAVK